MAHLATLVAQQLSRSQTQIQSKVLTQFETSSAGSDRAHPSLVADLPADIPMVETAVLELSLPLHQQIRQFAELALAAGYHRVQIVPLFLLPGVHVMTDIPAEVAIAQQILGSDLTLEVRPYLGSHPQLPALFAGSGAVSLPVGRILLSHGSRRVGGNQPVEAIATQLKALPAYWSGSPCLEDQVGHLVKQGKQQIVILTYFLFEGVITDAIAQTVSELKHRFAKVHLHLASPLGVTLELAQIVVGLTR
ncbi:MAG: sirohydrochlorin chelatase [Leptolyngbyaceae cyanobacterium CRU_2_3]|nr:sirohydrochlorin chelatase [Leptolyngbyaceae cyanobacterium CRU_2_3]